MIDVTPFVNSLDGKPVAVFGLGISNLAAIKALIAAGAEVSAWDDDKTRRKEAEIAGATIADLTKADMGDYGCLVLAPGVPFTHNPHKVVKQAKAAGIRRNNGGKTAGIRRITLR